MNDIFIKIYLDEDVNVLIARLVRAKNFTSVAVSEVGRRGRSDAEQLSYAVQNGYTILTHNRLDFEKLVQEYYADNKSHYGIIIAVRRPVHEVAERLLNTLNDFTADEMINQIIYI